MSENLKKDEKIPEFDFGNFTPELIQSLNEVFGIDINSGLQKTFDFNLIFSQLREYNLLNCNQSIDAQKNEKSEP